MNRTLIAVALLALPALATTPAATAADVVCGERVERAVENAQEALARLLRNSAGDTECPADGGVPDCDDLASLLDTEGGSKFDPCAPPFAPCSGGQKGAVVLGRPACTDAAVEPCELDLCGGTPPGGRDLPTISEGPKDPECSKSEDDWGFGGTHVTCEFACGKLDELGLGVVAQDEHAGTYGDTECGGTTAECNSPAPTCQDVSNYLTSYPQHSQKCNGHSDEFNSSPVTVYCFAVGAGTATRMLCAVDERLCPKAGVSVGAVCAEQLPGAIDAAILLAGAIPAEPGLSLVAMRFDSLGGFAIRYEADDDGRASCAFQEFVL